MANKKGVDFYDSATSDIFEDVYKFNKNSIIENMENFIQSVDLEPLSKILYLDFNILLFFRFACKDGYCYYEPFIRGQKSFFE